MYYIENNFLTPNRWSRPQFKIKKIKGIVIHWVANPNTSAKNNRDFFENRKGGKLDFGSAHEVIDLDGDIIVCIPDTEMAYNCGSATYTSECLNRLGDSPNYYTYSIECTHIDWNGKMTDATYNTLVERCVDLCKKYGLTSNDLWLHKEVVGWKDCHKYFVDNPDKWKAFKQKVHDLLNPIKKEIVDTKLASTEIRPDMFKNNSKEILNMFNDINDVSEWAKPSVERLEKLEIFKGDEHGNFNPHFNITREEFSVVIDRVLKLLGK
jgi:N-acetylmuramoyl-L-alanine amidase CwlA